MYNPTIVYVYFAVGCFCVYMFTKNIDQGNRGFAIVWLFTGVYCTVWLLRLLA